MASQATPPNNGDGGMALPEGGAMLPNLAASLTSSTASKWNDDERRQAHAHNRMKSTQRWERVEELQGQVTDFEDKLRRAGEYGQQLVDRNEYLESRLKLLNAELAALREDATASSEDTELLYARNGELSSRLQQLEQENLQLSQALASAGSVGGPGEGKASGSDHDTHAQALSSLRAEVCRLTEECSTLRDQLTEKTLEAKAHARNTAAARSASPPNVPTVPVVRREHASTSTSDDDLRDSIKLKLGDGRVCGLEEVSGLLASQSQALHALTTTNAHLTAQLTKLEQQHKTPAQGPPSNGQWVLASDLEAAQAQASTAHKKAQDVELRARRLESQCAELKQRLEDREAELIHTPNPHHAVATSSSSLLCSCCTSLDSFVRVLMGGGRSSGPSSRPIGVRRGGYQSRNDSLEQGTSDTSALR